MSFDEEASSGIMCSVLNVVIDYTIEEITPMEAEEWNARNTQRTRKKECNKKDNCNNILVPVIRIFGPVLRGNQRQPLQSACLHIHGAFPYIL